ncbi:MAG: site-2 protease family protein [Proteobacteria bacterium]|nr:site-2 protease family protein [Pseudomonadota bacterium]
MIGGLSVLQISTWIIPILVAITLHEAAHAYVAWKLGDDTAHQQGRVTFNPFRHIDPFGTIFLPALLIFVRAPFLIGYAKPVPVNFYRLRRPRRDMVLVAAAGPAMNILLALAAGLLLQLESFLPAGAGAWYAETMERGVILNVLLAVFNMIPLPPLDGGRVAVGLLPRALARPLARLERFGFFILIGIMLFLPSISLQLLGREISVFDSIILPVVRFLATLILTVTGHG